MSAIVEKIKKLLRMRRGGTPAEIETALAIAHRIAHEHGLDLSKIDPNEEASSEAITHVEQLLKSRLPLEAQLASAILVRYFNISVMITRRFGNVRQVSLNFVGTTLDTEVARY